MTRTAAETHRECTASLREDRNCGLIYGPYKVGTEFVNSHVFAAATGRCTYCGADLPRGRKVRLMKWVPERLAMAVVGCW